MIPKVRHKIMTFYIQLYCLENQVREKPYSSHFMYFAEQPPC